MGKPELRNEILEDCEIISGAQYRQNIDGEVAVWYNQLLELESVLEQRGIVKAL